MPLKTYYLASDGDLRTGLDEHAVRAAFESKRGVLLVDVEGTTVEDVDVLGRVFGFHPLAFADCVSGEAHLPKIDDFDDHVCIIVHGVNYTSESDIVEAAELALFLGPNFVVSNHAAPLLSVG